MVEVVAGCDGGRSDGTCPPATPASRCGPRCCGRALLRSSTLNLKFEFSLSLFCVVVLRSAPQLSVNSEAAESWGAEREAATLEPSVQLGVRRWL